MLVLMRIDFQSDFGTQECQILIISGRSDYFAEGANGKYLTNMVNVINGRPCLLVEGVVKNCIIICNFEVFLFLGLSDFCF